MIKHCLVSKHCVWYNLNNDKYLIRLCKTFCLFKQVWYRLATQFNIIIMCGYQTMLDCVWLPNSSVGKGPKCHTTKLRSVYLAMLWITLSISYLSFQEDHLNANGRQLIPRGSSTSGTSKHCAHAGALSKVGGRKIHRLIASLNEQP